MARVSSVRAKPACCPIRVKMRTINVASLTGHQGRQLEEESRLTAAKRPMIIVGSECLQRPDGPAIHSNARTLAGQLTPSTKDHPVFNVLHRFASQVAALDLGYTPSVNQIKQAKPRILFLLGADRETVTRADLPKDCLVVFVGHHGDRGASMADVVLPGAAYTEKNAIYANTEGRAQHTQLAVVPPGLGREDWRIFRAISEVVGTPLPYDNLEQVRYRMASIAPGLTEMNIVQPASTESRHAADQLLKLDKNTRTMNTRQPIALSLLTLSDYFITDCISRASQTMAKCVKAIHDAATKTS
ncbi:unnamed protein product [Echinostoma caproni]|uniref:NADH-ubiquinone oxidoreductase 75 kDa subunit, mitochondrial n=1 Tax=Echinostoma caproni TaxID=27848 RepID=A0A183B644_9TREM|nr:unnamed protein product [Echinostoma caproni]